mmetsp:Transcript_12279/g.39509  ORF Transcript_12279/g.39509 Transcript_12279/m.39509 type:complete len:325 (-) Transcript_12279:146-1120(-)
MRWRYHRPLGGRGDSRDGEDQAAPASPALSATPPPASSAAASSSAAPPPPPPPPLSACEPGCGGRPRLSLARSMCSASRPVVWPVAKMTRSARTSTPPEKWIPPSEKESGSPTTSLVLRSKESSASDSTPTRKAPQSSAHLALSPTPRVAAPAAAAAGLEGLQGVHARPVAHQTSPLSRGAKGAAAAATPLARCSAAPLAEASASASRRRKVYGRRTAHVREEACPFLRSARTRSHAALLAPTTTTLSSLAAASSNSSGSSADACVIRPWNASWYRTVCSWGGLGRPSREAHTTQSKGPYSTSAPNRPPSVRCTRSVASRLVGS